MNIFEVLATDSADSNSLFMAYEQAQKNWNLFKENTKSFLEQPSREKQQMGKKCWRQIMKNSPEIAFMTTQFYISQLTDHLKCNVRQSIKSQKDFYKQMKVLSETIFPNRQFVRMFNDPKNFMLMQITELTKQIAIEFNLKEKFTSQFVNAFLIHCRKIMEEEIIDLEKQTKQYISEKFGSIGFQKANEKTMKELLEFGEALGLLDWLCQPCFQFLNNDLNSFICFYVDPSQGSQFHKQCLNYGRTFQKSFLKVVSSEKTYDGLKVFLGEVDQRVYFMCSKFCSDKILDIILDFPESYPTIISLKECIQKSNFLYELSDKLVKEVQKRLLIPGVLTLNILNQYINMLKVLQILDPHGFIFDQNTVPIKNYLLRRNDTLRCIISFLTDDVQNYPRIQNEPIKLPSTVQLGEMESDEDENAAQKWEIFAKKENKTKVRVKYQQSDLVTILVNFYGSQQAFINEYQNMLAEKLMSAKDYNIDEEIKNIERLKIRFGEMALQTCNIIVRDVKDSKKLDKQIHSNCPLKSSKCPITLPQMNCLSVSKGYWPINYDASNSHIPSTFKEVFDDYAHLFSKMKAMMKIDFHYNLGYVNLTLSFKNGAFDFKCMPIHAMMITCFDDEHIKDKNIGVSSEELSNWLNIAQSAVKQKMSFWVHKGVIKEAKMAKQGLSLKKLNSLEDGDLVFYKPVEDYHQIASNDIDDDIDNLIIKESTSNESHLKHIMEGLIISILNINGPKPPEKIHLLLKTIYKTDLDYNYGEAQTLEILKKMVQKRKIDFNGETYSSRSES